MNETLISDDLCNIVDFYLCQLSNEVFQFIRAVLPTNATIDP